jgi:biotin operon repressor
VEVFEESIWKEVRRLKDIGGRVKNILLENRERDFSLTNG